MQKRLVIEAPAKINLTLDVLGKRSDGYHDLASVMHSIDLRDIVVLELTENRISVTTNSPALPDNEENLAFRAAQLILHTYGLPIGVQIHIEKNIPIGAGLAGGSTDAAGVLRGLNQLLDMNLSLEQICELGSQIGSDVPFCILQGTALACGRGEILTPLNRGPQLYMVLVKPPYQLSTAEVYRELDLELVYNRPDNEAFVRAWQECDIIGIMSNMINVLETVSLAKCPEIAIIKKKLAASGAVTTFMSGSGPSVVGLFVSHDGSELAWQKLKEQYQETYLVSSYYGGE